PGYFANTECVPTVRLEVENTACWLPLSGTAGAWATPSTKKVTEPVGVPDAAVTVAVNETDWLNRAGLSEERILTDVATPLTLSGKTAEVLPAKLPVAAYLAVRLWTPAEKPEVLIDACWLPPTLPRLADPSEAAPSKKVTLPVGVPAALE